MEENTITKKKPLSIRREKFCQLYLDYDKDLFGNGVQCYLEVYDIDTSKPHYYKTACAAAGRLLSNVGVCDRIAELLGSAGFNDENITKQHLFLINQHKDFGVKMKALSDYYKLKNKYPASKVDLTSGGEVIKGFNFIKNDSNNKAITETGESVGDTPKSHN